MRTLSRGAGRRPSHATTWTTARQRLLFAGPPLVQASVASGLAWFVAHNLIGHETPVFAPIGALLVLSNAPGRRTSRVIATALGAVIGVAVGDLLIAAIGTGAVQVAVVALLTMGLATALGADAMLITQAGIAAVLIATIEPPRGIYSPLAGERLIDVLVGGACGLAATIVLPLHPLRHPRIAGAKFFAELHGVLADMASALEPDDAAAADRALERARTLDGALATYRLALDTADETTRISPFYWRLRGPVARMARSASRLDLAVRDVRVLGRAVLRAIEIEPPTPDELAVAVRELASAVQAVEADLEHGGQGDSGSADALRAAGRATLVARGGASMPVSAIVGQVRTTAADLLQALGLDREEAVGQIRRDPDLLLSDRQEPGR